MTARAPTRILALTNWYPPHHYGGYEIAAYDVLTRLAARGHEVAVLCSDHRKENAEPPPSLEHEQRVDRSLHVYFEDGEPSLPRWRERWAIEKHNHRAFAAAVERFRPDVIATWHMGAMSLGLITAAVERGLPVVHSLCDDWLVYGPDLDRWARLFSGTAPRHVLGRAVRPVVRVPTALPDLGATGPVLFISELTKSRAETLAPWSYAHAPVVGSGIDRSWFPAQRPERAAKPWGWRMIYVGRFDERKGAATLIRALPLLPAQATVELNGRGGDAERERLFALATELGVADRVTFGEVKRGELAGLYASADCVVFPSEWPEPFGLVPIEAMSCGTPVVATGVGGSGEFLDDGDNCVLFAAGDAEGLAAAVRRLADDPALRRRVVEAGFETAELYDVEHLTDAFEAWYAGAATRYRDGLPVDRLLPGRPPTLPRPPSGDWLADATPSSPAVWAQNRLDATRTRERLSLRVRGLRPARVGLSAAELERALPPGLRARRRLVAGWEGSRKRELATRAFTRGPLRRYARLVGVETEPA